MEWKCVNEMGGFYVSSMWHRFTIADTWTMSVLCSFGAKEQLHPTIFTLIQYLCACDTSLYSLSLSTMPLFPKQLEIHSWSQATLPASLLYRPTTASRCIFRRLHDEILGMASQHIELWRSSFELSLRQRWIIISSGVHFVNETCELSRLFAICHGNCSSFQIWR